MAGNNTDKLLKSAELALKINQCRNTVIRLWPETWKKEIEIHDRLIKACAQKHGLDMIPASMKLIQDMGKENGRDVFSLKLMAALAQILEPV